MPFESGFLLGANLPWSAATVRGGEPKRTRAGWDFGPGPEGWWSEAAMPLPRAWAKTRVDLAYLRELGVRDVRFFVLLNGVNYPVREPLERCGEIRSRGLAEVFVRDAALPLPPLPPEFVRDFEGLLDVCAAVGVRLWPSLVSFELFGPLVRHDARVTSGGRASLVVGDDGSESSIERFLDATLAPLLVAARARSHAIGAFEVVNEPDWAVLRGVPRAAMGRFLVLAARRIAEAGLVSTIGFSYADPPWLPRRDFHELARLAARGEYVHQLHHYPGIIKTRRLERHDDAPIRPCVVGEMPTSRGTWTPSPNMRWKDPGLAETDVRRFLLERLELVRRRGYPGAFVWGLHSVDGATSWDEDQAAQIRAFSERL